MLASLREALLAYLPDPAATLRRLSGFLRPGGTIAFQEMVLPLMRSVPDGALFHKCREWMMETFERAGFELEWVASCSQRSSRRDCRRHR
jgi:trans-aconitate methyltransferase